MTNASDTERREEGRVAKDSPFFEVVERAYRVFDGPVPGSDHACTCCMDPDVKADFFAHGARGLPVAYYREWAGAAVPADLPRELWAWLLPRLLEMIASGLDVPPHGIETVLSRYPTGDASRWSAEEWSVIDDFQRLCLHHFPFDTVSTLDDVFCMFALGGWCAEEIGAQIDALPTDRLVEHLHRDWDMGCTVEIRLCAFWPDESLPWIFWTRRALFERFFLYGMRAGTPRPLAEKALALAGCIDAESQWDAPP